MTASHPPAGDIIERGTRVYEERLRHLLEPRHGGTQENAETQESETLKRRYDKAFRRGEASLGREWTDSVTNWLWVRRHAALSAVLVGRPFNPI